MSEQKPPSGEETTQTYLDPMAINMIVQGLARLTRQRQAPPQKEQTELPTPVDPEIFEDRLRMKVAKYRAANEQQAEQGFTENRETVTQRERLDKLLPIAQNVAAMLEKENNQEEQRRAALEKSAIEAQHELPSFGPNPYEPELTVEHTWVSRRRKVLPKINRFDSVPKIAERHEVECAKGWLLARTATMMDARPVVQEILLGTNGALYAYATDDQRSIEGLLSKPLSRKQIQDKGQDTTRPWHTQLSPLPLPKGAQYDEGTDPTIKNFHKLGEGEYPPPGIGGKGHMFADPAVIQQGLEDLVIEKFGGHKLA